MNTWKVILATIVIFATGVVTGGLLVHRSEAAVRARRNAAVAQGMPAGGMKLEFLRRIQRELDLTPAQRERVDAIISQAQERTRRVMEPVVPQLRAEVDKAKADFREVLTPPQQTRFDEILKQQQRARNQRHGQAPHERAPAEPSSPPVAPGSTN